MEPTAANARVMPWPKKVQLITMHSYDFQTKVLQLKSWMSLVVYPVLIDYRLYLLSFDLTKKFEVCLKNPPMFHSCISLTLK